MVAAGIFNAEVRPKTLSFGRQPIEGIRADTYLPTRADHHLSARPEGECHALDEAFGTRFRLRHTRSRPRGDGVICGRTCCNIGVPRGAATQIYPSRPITMIVPFSVGGPGDTLTRIMAEHMRASLGQPIIIDNVGGAAGR